MTIVFDLDGTLVDTAEDIGAAMNRALGASGLPPLPAATVRAIIRGLACLTTH
jgi:phosphoglycolate phosphatase